MAMMMVTMAVVDHHAGALVGELCPLHRPQAPLILSINLVNVDKQVAALLSKPYFLL